MLTYFYFQNKTNSGSLKSFYLFCFLLLPNLISDFEGRRGTKMCKKIVEEKIWIEGKWCNRGPIERFLYLHETWCCSRL